MTMSDYEFRVTSPSPFSPAYVESPSQARATIERIATYPLAGVDTEFSGVDIGAQSPAGRSVLHVWSVAVPSGSLLPRGFHEPETWVFAANTLEVPEVRAWLEGATIKAVHNLSVDWHTFRNHGIRLGGAVNTLAMARYWYPERAKREGFTLDSLGEDFCGEGKTENFDELLGYDATEYREAEVTKRRCACGELGCMKRKAPHDVKTEEQVIVARAHKVRKHIPLPDLNPSHRLWERYLAYAGKDAVLALWIYELMVRDKRQRNYPWA
jgi:hypothetical protein